MWAGGPSWHELPAFTEPEDPGTDDRGVHRNKVWDFWMTDYDLLFHVHIFADCPLNKFTRQSSTEEGKSSSSTGPGKNLYQKTEEGKSSTEEGKSSTEEGKSSTGAGKDICSSLYQKSSWFTYHGTSIMSAIVSVAMNRIDRSEKDY